MDNATDIWDYDLVTRRFPEKVLLYFFLPPLSLWDLIVDIKIVMVHLKWLVIRGEEYKKLRNVFQLHLFYNHNFILL